MAVGHVVAFTDFLECAPRETDLWMRRCGPRSGAASQPAGETT